jgi:hypothetical protein
LAYVNVKHGIAYGIEMAIDITIYGVVCYGTLRGTEKKVDGDGKEEEGGRRVMKRWFCCDVRRNVE